VHLRSSARLGRRAEGRTHTGPPRAHKVCGCECSVHFDRFWADTAQWPRDPSGHVFIGRAFNKTGSAMFGAQWTNLEGGERLPDLLPGTPSPPDGGSYINAQAYLTLDRQAYEAHQSRLAEVAKTLRARSRVATLWGGASRKGTPASTDLTPEEWARARQLNRQEYERILPSWERAQEVRTAIIAACETGELTAVHRAKSGGEMRPMPAIWWNSDEAAFYNLIFCDVPPEDPYRTMASPGRREFCWIFFTAESFDAFLVQRPNAQERAGLDFHLSPYLAAMHHVARKLKISPENQPKKIVVEMALREVWPTDPDRAQVLIEKAATLLREPGQTGRPPKSPRPKG
jgi:hypothetical protein